MWCHCQLTNYSTRRTGGQAPPSRHICCIVYCKDKRELLGFIEDYRQGHALQKAYTIVRTLQEPPGGFCQGACLGRAALNRYPVPDRVPIPSAAWVPQQVYLHPYPRS